MRDWLVWARQAFAFRAFLLRRLARYSGAELACVLASPPLPARVRFALWGVTLRLNPFHLDAALGRAEYLQGRAEAEAAEGRRRVLDVVENPARVSASDLALTRVPQRAWQRITGQDAAAHEERVKERFFALVGEKRAAGDGETTEVVNTGSDSYMRRGGEVREAWARAEAEWGKGSAAAAMEPAAGRIERGEFLSPFDALVWGERLMGVGTAAASGGGGTTKVVNTGSGSNARRLAAACLEWAREWLPEAAETWRLWGRWSLEGGERERAGRYLDRAWRLNPEDVSAWAALEGLARGKPLRETTTVRVTVNAPASLAVGAEAEVECIVEGGGRWQVHALPPAGWGLDAKPRVQETDDSGRAMVRVRATRPDRVRGEAWTLTCAAVGAEGFAVGRAQIAAPDTRGGRLLVVATEDHELWEERGTIPREDAERLLVEKSALAGERFAPWTHMVEAGTALAVLDWAAEQDAGWGKTREAARAHLAAEVARGNDLQAHLHAFNLPESPDFPYRLTAHGLAADPGFLLTAEERRRDFARAYAPRERIAAVAETVARLERIAQGADADYRALVWRSGQLEFGDDAADRAWSGVALKRAGLWADSDLPKRTFARGGAPRTAFFATMREPHAPRGGGGAGEGEILQFPVTGNLEGDFLTDARTLGEVARRTGETLGTRPGAHAVTLLTHDKFINARRGRDEFRLDENYNEWETIRAHLEAWRAAGGEQVTAREAVEALWDDGAWQLTARLGGQEILAGGTVRYRMRLLGEGIPVSETCPQWVLVTIPPFLREDLARARVRQGGGELETERNGAGDFWVRLTGREPEIVCEFELRQALRAELSANPTFATEMPERGTR